MKILVLVFCVVFGGQVYPQWQQVQGPYGGRIYSFFEDGSTVYITTESGIYRTQDKGKSWSQVQSALPENRLYHSLIYKFKYALFLEAQILTNNSSKGQLYRSADGGKTFQLVADSTRTHSLAHIKDTLYLAQNGENYIGRLFRSIDLGKTWQSFSPDSMAVRSITTDGRCLYAITSTESDQWQVRRSSDAGYTWEVIRGLPTDGYRRTPSFAHVNSTAGDTSLWIGYRSYDNKITQPTLFYLSSTSDSAVDAHFPLHEISYESDKTVRQVRSKDGKLYAMTSDEVYVHDTSGWSNITYNLKEFAAVIPGWSLNDFYPIRGIDGPVIVSLPHEGGIVRLDPSAKQYVNSDTGLNFLRIDKILNRNDTLYALTLVHGQHIYYSTNHGLDWRESGYKQYKQALVSLILNTRNGLLVADGDTAAFMQNFNIVHSAPIGGPIFGYDRTADTIYGWDGRQYFVSGDEGATWTQRPRLPFLGLSVSTAHESLLFAGSDSLFVSPDGAFTWSLVNTFPEQVEQYFALGSDGSYLFAAVQYFEKGIRYFGIFRSTDKGQNWELISTRQTSDIRSTVLYPFRGLVICGTDHGVFLCGYNGGRWAHLKVGDGGVTSITRDSVYVYVGTGRSGIWKAAIADLMEYANVQTSSKNDIDQLDVYPNPLQPGIDITISGEYSSMQILDVLGHIVFRSERQARYDLSRLTSGTYLVRSFDRGGAFLNSAKFVKE